MATANIPLDFPIWKEGSTERWLVLKADVRKRKKIDLSESVERSSCGGLMTVSKHGSNQTAALVGCSSSAEVIIYQKWSKQGTLMNQRQGHEWLNDARGEQSLAHVVRSNR